MPRHIDPYGIAVASRERSVGRVIAAWRRLDADGRADVRTRWSELADALEALDANDATAASAWSGRASFNHAGND
jgi:hypothetical protein